ncbi:MFS transporter [Micromonospora sp. WMMA1363]|uniref:MFS transporter n=1 Tax=Micromonospora sp. WMMA1363 TaxID=3053985 RepID=UPI00259C810C|nr:MFS transporter [Micromonospora sp. WMMA1363]MDM4720549.1 MFS transporter [Micromonospora sp. WMMA1363]
MTPHVPEESVAPANRRSWVALAVLALPTLLLSIDVSMLYLALPQLTAELRPSATELLWTTDVYGFMIAAFLIPMGAIGDRIGRRRLLLIGAAAFGLTSVVAAYATTPATLILARALLGIAGATLMPCTLGLISDIFRVQRQRQVAIGVWAACFSGGVTVGPVVGGLMLDRFWWGSVFLLGVPVMALLLIAGPILLPAASGPRSGRVDALSVVLSVTAIMTLVYGIKALAAHGVALVPLISLLAGAVCGVVFVRRQRALESPMLDLSLFTRREFSVALTVLLFALAAMGGANLFIAQYLQLVVGLSPLAVGLWLLVPSAVLMVSALTAPLLAHRIHPGRVIGFALIVTVVGYLMVTRVPSRDGLPLLLVALTVVHVGLGPIMSLGTDLVVGSAPPEKAGAASAASETSSELGLSSGIATLGTLGTVVYRDQLPEAPPAGVPVEAMTGARETLAAGIELAEQLPEQAGVILIAAARDAFTDSMAAVVLVSAGITASLAVMSLIVFARRPVSSSLAKR